MLDFIALYIPVGHFDFIEMAGLLGGCAPPNYSYKIRGSRVPPKYARGYLGERLLNYIEQHRTS